MPTKCGILEEESAVNGCILTDATKMWHFRLGFAPIELLMMSEFGIQFVQEPECYASEVGM
jgi:hypothetical protein